jgi:hypothetical protein
MTSDNTRAVSVSGGCYARLRAAADGAGTTIASLVEAAVASDPAFAAYEATLPPAPPLERRAPRKSSPQRGEPSELHETAVHVASAAQGRQEGVATPQRQPEVSPRRAPANLLRGTCAICTDYRAGAMEMLDGREVFVCVRCTDEHPRAGGYDAGQVGRCAADTLTAGGKHKRKAGGDGSSGQTNEGRF